MPLNKLAALPKLHKVIIGALSAFVVLLMLVPDGANTPRPQPNFEPGKHYPVPVDAVSLLPPQGEMPARFNRTIHWSTYEVQPGESMAYCLIALASAQRISIASLMPMNEPRAWRI